MITKTIMTLGIMASFVIGISFSSVYAGIPWGTDEIADDAITSEKIKKKQVKTSDIRNNAIKSSKIENGEVKSEDIATDAVGKSEIAANAVGGAEIAANAVGPSEIATDAVGGAEIAPNAVGSTEILNNSIQAADIQTNAVGQSEIAANSVGFSEIKEATLFYEILFDDVPGHTAGWDPNGVLKTFTISDSRVADDDYVGVAIDFQGASPTVCSSYNTFTNSFNVACTVAPIQGSMLIYLVSGGQQ